MSFSDGTRPARFGVEARITEFNATLKPIVAGLVADARVAVVSMMGSFAPVTVAHTGALERSRKVLMGEYAHEFTPRPYQLVVCFLRQNHAEYVAQKLENVGQLEHLSGVDCGVCLHLACSGKPGLFVEDSAHSLWKSQDSDEIRFKLTRLYIHYIHVHP